MPSAVVQLDLSAREDAEQLRRVATEAGAAEIDAAKAHGRELVAEAQLVRQRILRDLARRRKQMRVQVEQLRAARDRLIEAHVSVRNSLDEAERELDLALPQARAASNIAARRVESEPEMTPAQLENEIELSRLVEIPLGAGQTDSEPITDEVPLLDVSLYENSNSDHRSAKATEQTVYQIPDETLEEEPLEVSPEVFEPPLVIDLRDHAVGESWIEPELTEASAVEAPIIAAPPAAQPAPIDETLVAGEAQPEPIEPAVEETSELQPEAPVTTEVETPSDIASDSSTTVDDLFARIRESRLEAVERAHQVLERVPSPQPPPWATGAAAEAEPAAGGVAVAVLTGDALLVSQRDEALAGFEQQMARLVKRFIGDEQNEMQAAIRRGKDRTSVAEVLIDRDAQIARYVEVIQPIAFEVERVAAESVGASVRGGSAVVVSIAERRFARSLVDPLRSHVERVFDETAGDDERIDRVRSAFREAKQRVDGAVGEVAVAVFNATVVAALEGAPVRWVTDPAGDCSPDCQDNALAGVVLAGAPFPSGPKYPPAHHRCRCLIVSAFRQ